jgi:branched-chain amino acid transport system permease protein
MTELIQQLANGLAAGAIYALIAVGYSLVYGVLELINFAHGDVYMFATFVALTLLGIGLPWPFAVMGAVLVGALLGVLVERFAYRPLRDADRIAPTVSAIGAALILENLAQLIWGPETRPFPFVLSHSVIHIGGVTLAGLQLVILAVAALIALALYLVVQRTSWGRWMRAIRDDTPTAALIGIPVNKTIMAVYAIGGGIGVIGGVLFAAYYNATYIGMGFTGTMNAFAAAVLGGIGSLPGAFVGGLLLGVTQALAVGYVASGYENTVSFLVLIAVLILRPNGLFGRQHPRRV